MVIVAVVTMMTRMTMIKPITVEAVTTDLLIYFINE
jgi:hypothetical protein